MSTVKINPLRPSPSHSATESQSFRFSVQIFRRSALAGGPDTFFSPGPEPAVGGPDGDEMDVISITTDMCAAINENESVCNSVILSFVF